MENANTENIVVVKVRITYNNIWIYAPDNKGEMIVSLTSTQLGFTKAKRTSIEAIKAVAETVASELKQKDIFKVIINYSSMGTGIQQVIDSFKSSGIEVKHILDITPIPHNAMRPKRNKQ